MSLAALGKLFALDARPPNAPLFMVSGAFSRHNVVGVLKETGPDLIGLSEVGYSGHSLRKEAAQYAAENVRGSSH